MGSVGNPNSWAPYDNLNDCSQPICSIYCPHFCYSIFPPPPSDEGKDSVNPFSPLIISIIGVLASGLLLASYYIILSRYCRRRNNDRRPIADAERIGSDPVAHDQLRIASDGLDEALIKTITVCRYQKSGGCIEGSDCAVCLSEFQENESLRVLSKCRHAFHLPCIDTWLKSHSNCPLCRATVVVFEHPSTGLELNSLEFRRREDQVDRVMVDDLGRSEQVVVNLGNEEAGDQETGEGDQETGGGDQESVEQFRGSISLANFSCRPHLLISDILKIEEMDEDLGYD